MISVRYPNMVLESSYPVLNHRGILENNYKLCSVQNEKVSVWFLKCYFEGNMVQTEKYTKIQTFDEDHGGDVSIMKKFQRYVCSGDSVL